MGERNDSRLEKFENNYDTPFRGINAFLLCDPSIRIVFQNYRIVPGVVDSYMADECSAKLRQHSTNTFISQRHNQHNMRCASTYHEARKCRICVNGGLFVRQVKINPNS